MSNPEEQRVVPRYPLPKEKIKFVFEELEKSGKLNLPRWQREEMTFVPGEYTHQSFRSQFFNGLCANCHGAVSGKPVDVALNPDFMTQASTVLGAAASPTLLTGAPGGRGSVQGPPFSP